MRNVERDGEGLVTTTFGDFPGREPQWPRAALVLGLLETVWTRSKPATPGLPAAQSKMVEDAIARLRTTIPAKNQKDAVIASNAIGLAVSSGLALFCPCHGSTFSLDGTPMGGPARIPLPHYAASARGCDVIVAVGQTVATDLRS
jgi:hypothetical protein